MKYSVISSLLFLCLSVSSLAAADEPATLPPTLAEVSYGSHEMNVLDFWRTKEEGQRSLLDQSAKELDILKNSYDSNIEGVGQVL